jgi:predicted CoA-substrate-specific enzyme activase
MVVLQQDQVVLTNLLNTGFTPLKTAGEMLASVNRALQDFEIKTGFPAGPDKTTPNSVQITATGYGRHAAKAEFAQRVITEIKAHAIGVTRLFPQAKTILDIGGQDTKVIQLDSKGNVTDFQMNDKCSAGTGKFLEVMAAALGYNSPEDFGQDALQGKPGIKISNMCTVFAESEAISLLHGGYTRRDIASALHSSTAEKAASMLQRVGLEPPVAFTGGVALNPCIVKMLEEMLQTTLLIPENPQLVGALGAALA